MSITIIIIAITVVVSISAFNNAEIFQKCLMNPFMVSKKGQYWRLITSGFVHGSFIHLGFNMFTFYFFGRVVEQVFGQILGASGSIVFILFYLSALIVSDLPTVLKNRNNVNYNTLGASGAVSAVVFASILYFPLEKIYLFGIIGFPGFILGIFYILYSYFQGKNMSDNINHDAHLYGAVYGAVFGIIVYPASASGFVEQISSYSFF
ncbi:MAG: rhomboid family intramembrane serine protease [Marinoscillum sp.]